MRINSKDDTLKKNYIQKYQYLVSEYEQVKSKNHPTFKTAKEFYLAHGTCPQTFLKYYGRFKQSNGNVETLLPQKRGPRYTTRRTPIHLEEMILKQRNNGCNKYEICDVLKEIIGERVISPSGVYNVLKRNGTNRITTVMKEEKRRIIKEKAGELGHIDCHHLSRDLIANDSKKYYLLAVVDSCTRLAWVEVIHDIKAITVMFATMRCFKTLKSRYGIQFQEVITDNGPEFGPRGSAQKEHHPFERLLMEMDVKHRYTRPYRPQTNGKVERFWRTLNEDLIEGTYFESIEDFKDNVLKYTLYYNEIRCHSAINGMTPIEFNKNLEQCA
jgi:hypothetical protein